jgi:hypothetical protein
MKRLFLALAALALIGFAVPADATAAAKVAHGKTCQVGNPHSKGRC